LKYILSLLTIFSISAFANDELKSIYLAFESDYMSNDASKYSQWLTDEEINGVNKWGQVLHCALPVK
jgi:hypothetical protein